MTTPLLVAFDLDDTLAPSKTAIDARMGALLAALSQRVEVAIISGGQWEQFNSQLVANLPADTDLMRIHLLPTCGTQYWRHDGSTFAPLYAENLTEQQKADALRIVEAEARELDLWEAEPWGNILEDRGSQITFSALGQQAPLDAKKAWDPDGTKKATLRDAVAVHLPELEVRSGGSTSIDITRKGIDKAYGMNKLAAATGIALADMLFYGDRLDEGGNDRPVLDMGVACVSVEGPAHTADFLDALIPELS